MVCFSLCFLTLPLTLYFRKTTPISHYILMCFRSDAHSFCRSITFLAFSKKDFKSGTDYAHVSLHSSLCICKLAATLFFCFLPIGEIRNISFLPQSTLLLIFKIPLCPFEMDIVSLGSHLDLNCH